MKLVINIPCYNEEKTLPSVLREIPKRIEGIDVIEVQIVDDGSTDKTSEVAAEHGCVVIRHKRNKGLGVAFSKGVKEALKRGADVFVNTDADNQYPSRYIPRLVKPVLDHEADIVIGNRKPWKVKHFSPIKRFLQFLGNGITRRISGTKVPDMVSGFRAYSREALLMLNVTTKFSYVLDTVVQASKKGLKIRSVYVKVNPPTRRSRLFKNIFQHMRKSAANILRVYSIYEPFRTFLFLSFLFFVPGFILLSRFFFFYFTEPGPTGYIQSLIVSTVFLVFSGLMFSLGIIGELISVNRILIEDDLYLKKKQSFGKNQANPKKSTKSR